mmetsp:Transcript_14335/g.36144  ORF Transcript_14335/g.36144 Transcript_14335/m.36144 type:complete len:278 (+) Transcript_14335:2354-3187(+)
MRPGDALHQQVLLPPALPPVRPVPIGTPRLLLAGRGQAPAAAAQAPAAAAEVRQIKVRLRVRPRAPAGSPTVRPVRGARASPPGRPFRHEDVEEKHHEEELVQAQDVVQRPLHGHVAAARLVPQKGPEGLLPHARPQERRGGVRPADLAVAVVVAEEVGEGAVLRIEEVLDEGDQLVHVRGHVAHERLQGAGPALLALLRPQPGERPQLARRTGRAVVPKGRAAQRQQQQQHAAPGQQRHLLSPTRKPSLIDDGPRPSSSSLPLPRRVRARDPTARR